jgi:hypothetical protein
MMQIVNVDLKRSHYGATAEDVCRAFNVGRGTSHVLQMAVDPEHRRTVEEYADIVHWKIANTEGEPLAKWRAVAEHLRIVLTASQSMHDATERKMLAKTADGRTQ